MNLLILIVLIALSITHGIMSARPMEFFEVLAALVGLAAYPVAYLTLLDESDV